MCALFKRISAEDFLKRSERLSVIDVRSPGEFLRGHIPGAVNIPVFNDSQRAVIGTVYTHKGRGEAAITAMELMAGEMPEKMRKAISVCEGKEVLLYCWRGGMRSESMAWLLSFCGIKPFLLEGGYKSYRGYILDYLSQKRKYIVLGGMTGSGKTKILGNLALKNHQVIDLEGLACHKGSAFGSLGMPDQPSTEHFANLLYSGLSHMNNEMPVWLEDESSNIGKVFLPEGFFDRLSESPVISLMMPAEVRIPQLVKEYTCFPKQEIIASIERIAKRLGREKAGSAVKAVNSDDYETAVSIVLGYYDKAYQYGLLKRKEGQVIYVETDTDDAAINAEKVISAAKDSALL